MIPLSDKWVNFLVSEPETGMGYHVVSVILADGRKYDRIIIDGGYITRIAEYEDIPFREEDIREIVVTHDKWDFRDRGK